MKDLGLSTCSATFIKQLIQDPMKNNPLAGTEDISSPDDVALSTGGSICLFAYWIFSSTIFDADQPEPDIYVFPEHFALLERLLEESAQSQVEGAPGTIDAVVALGLWLVEEKRLSASPGTLPSSSSSVTSPEGPTANYMVYHHLLTLISVYHPSVLVRNAASNLAGSALHADPNDRDRLRILDDLLENCMYAQLKACAVTWLREEILVAAGPGAPANPRNRNVFAGPHALDTIQFSVFQDITWVPKLDPSGLQEYWVANAPFILQAANFALFLWADGGRFAASIPKAMDTNVAVRWVKPLMVMTERLSKTSPGEGGDRSFTFGVDVLKERLGRLATTEAFKPFGIGNVQE